MTLLEDLHSPTPGMRAAVASKKDPGQKDIELGAPNPKEAPQDTPHGPPQAASRTPGGNRPAPGADGAYLELPAGPVQPERRSVLGMLGGMLTRPGSRGVWPGVRDLHGPMSSQTPTAYLHAG